MNCPKCHQLIPEGRPPEQCPNCLLARAKFISIDTAIGENFGHAGPYVLTGKLGEGSFGEVFFGEQHEPMYREAAIKLLKRDLISNPAMISRFRAEAQALTALDHPNIARLYEAGTTANGQPFIALELISGTPITAWCEARELGIDGKLSLFKNVCAAMQHAHDRGLVHRDLKPDNILVDLESGEPKVIDFGVARSTTTLLQKDAMLTGGLDIIGTPAYLSPEQTDGGSDNIDTRSDIYALGVVLYELLTGRTPLGSESDNHFELLKAIREKAATAPSTIEPSISPAIDAVVLKALAKNREERFQTAADFAEALDAKNFPPQPQLKSGRSIKPIILGATVLAVILAGVIIATKPPLPESPPPVQDSTHAPTLAGYEPPFSLIEHGYLEVSEGAGVDPPFSSESKFVWFRFHDSDGEDLLFAFDSEYTSDSASLFILGAKSAHLPAAEFVQQKSATDSALIELLASEYARLPQQEWNRIDSLSWDDVDDDSKDQQLKLFFGRYLSFNERRRNLDKR